MRSLIILTQQIQMPIISLGLVKAAKSIPSLEPLVSRCRRSKGTPMAQPHLMVEEAITLLGWMRFGRWLQ
ncbi:MAG: hypothetical protein ACI9WO_002131 [Sphingobacteriales bacterium]|jgi:hypothetical protein